jgi:hypothetical protein
MKLPMLDCLLGFVSALFFALVLPVLLHGGFGFLGYDTLTAYFPGLMATFAGALLMELILYVILSAIVFGLYVMTPLYKRAHAHTAAGPAVRSAIGWFLLGNILGYLVFGVVVAAGISAWRGPAL